MIFLRSIICALLVGLGLLVLAAGSAVAGDNWRPVTAAELAQKSSEVEKDADAEAIFWDVRVDDDHINELALSYYVRIKIFTERGRETYGKVDITIDPGSQIKDVGARVIKPDGSIVEISKDDMFDRTIVKFGHEKLKAKSFAVPGAEPGVIVEYRYREVYPYSQANLRLIFQHEIPVQSMTYSIRPFSGGLAMHILLFNVPDDVNFVDAKEDYRRLTLTNVPAFHEEPQMPPIDQVRPWIMLYYANEGGLKLDAYWKQYSIGLSEATKELLKPNDEIKQTAAEVIGGAVTPDDKLVRLYDFCQTKIKNLSYDPTMTEDDKAKLKENRSPGDVLKRAMGWGSDIDLLFAALVNAAGMEAQIVWAGDRGNLFFDRTNKSIRLVHPACIAVKFGDDWRFFQPGAKFVPYGMLSWNEEDQDALIPNSKGAIWTKTPLSGPEKSREKRSGRFRLLEDGTLEGKVRIEYTGQLSFVRKLDNFDDSVTAQEKTLRDEIKTRLSTAELSDIKIENVSDPKNPFAYSFSIRVPGYAQRTGKRLFLQPGFFEHGYGAVFTATERKFDVYFHYPWSEEDDISIELPPGFTVDSAETPTPITPEMTLGISGLTIRMGMAQDKKTLVYRRSFFFGGKGNTLFPKSSYAGLKGLFESIRQADDHTIILRQP